MYSTTYTYVHFFPRIMLFTTWLFFSFSFFSPNKGIVSKEISEVCRCAHRLTGFTPLDTCWLNKVTLWILFKVLSKFCTIFQFWFSWVDPGWISVDFIMIPFIVILCLSYKCDWNKPWPWMSHLHHATDLIAFYS